MLGRATMRSRVPARLTEMSANAGRKNEMRAIALPALARGARLQVVTKRTTAINDLNNSSYEILQLRKLN
jgi:hypothetical protein